MQLSKTQEKALMLIDSWGGVVVLYSGGYWSWPDNENYKMNSIGTSTVDALVKKRLLKFTEYKNNYRGKCGVKAELVNKGG